MAVWAIGDIQGCYTELTRLLAQLQFNAARDRVWLVGDLINRGPHSAQVLRWARNLGEAATVVLGNHELHLLAVAGGHTRVRAKDTFHDILAAPDRDELLQWLRHRPLLHHDATLGYTLVHAGLPPAWDLPTAQACAAQAEAALRGPQYGLLLDHLYGDQPNQWSPELQGWERLRFIINCFTRLRYCDPQGRLTLKEKGPPGSQPAPYIPWFAVPGRASSNLKIVFGHWSTLGRLGEVPEGGVYPLDSGCIWGGALTAMRLDTAEEWVKVDCGGICGGREEENGGND